MRDAHAPPAASGGRPDSPVLKTQRRCPNCGREPAVVFQAVHTPPADGRSVSPLVCLECCPKVPADS
jgi:hypothetical protein